MTGLDIHDGDRIARSLDQPGDFGAVFERHFDAIHRYVARRLGTGPADDIAAAVFAEAFAGRATYLAEVGDARPWLYGIATNLIRRHRRRERAAWRAYARHGVDPLGIDAKPRLDEVAVARALGRIAKADRDALLLMVWAELTYDEIATALGIPVGTVRSRIHRARGTAARRTGEPPMTDDLEALRATRASVPPPSAAARSAARSRWDAVGRHVRDDAGPAGRRAADVHAAHRDRGCRRGRARRGRLLRDAGAHQLRRAVTCGVGRVARGGPGDSAAGVPARRQRLARVRAGPGRCAAVRRSEHRQRRAFGHDAARPDRSDDADACWRCRSRATSRSRSPAAAHRRSTRRSTRTSSAATRTAGPNSSSRRSRATSAYPSTT